MTSSPDAGRAGRVAVREGALLRGVAAEQAVLSGRSTGDYRGPERRAGGRRAGDGAVPNRTPAFRLGEVYAEEMTRLREQARTEGWAAGHAEGMLAAEAVLAETERTAAARLAEVQNRWERRLASATAAMAAAAAQLEQAVEPQAEELRDSIVTVVLTLLEDLLGRELELAGSPALDAVRRALTLCPADGPVLVRLHPDDLAELGAEDVDGLPDSVRLVADAAVERTGAVAETGPRRIDAQLGAALERVQAVLRS